MGSKTRGTGKVSTIGGNQKTRRRVIRTGWVNKEGGIAGREELGREGGSNWVNTEAGANNLADCDGMGIVKAPGKKLFIRGDSRGAHNSDSLIERGLRRKTNPAVLVSWIRNGQGRGIH